MRQEKLKAGYSFIALWRAVAHAAMVAGCVASLGFMTAALVVGIIAFNSQAPARKLAEDKQEKYEAACRQSIKQEREAYERYAAELPQRLEQIKRNHEQELKQYQKAGSDYSKAVRKLASEYNDTTSVTEGELKRLRCLNANDIKALSLPLSELKSSADSSDYSQTVEACAALLAKYRKMIVKSVMNSYEEYVAPLHRRISELGKGIADLNAQIESKTRYYDEKIEALERTRRSVPPNRYEGRPEKNIFGTTNISALSKIFDASDGLTLYASRLLLQSPLTERGRVDVRQKVLGLSDWLPTYTCIYAPSQEEKAAIEAHNAKLDEEIQKLYKEKQERIDELQQKLAVLQQEHGKLTDLKDGLVKEKEYLTKFCMATTEGWIATKRMSALQEKLKQAFPVEPDKLETKLKKEREQVPERERAMQAKVRSLEESIVSGQNALKMTLASMKFMERKACAAVLLPQMGIAAGILAATWVVFWVLLVLGDYMVCPLVVASMTQEIAVNTRKDENI